MGFVTIRKKKSFSPFWGGRGGPIKLTPLFGGVRNHPRKLLPKFQNANSKTLGVMSQKPKSQSINKNCDIFADIKTHTHKKKQKKNKKVSSRKSNVGTPKRILVKKFLKNSHYFYLSNETNRLHPCILEGGRSLKNGHFGNRL